MLSIDIPVIYSYKVIISSYGLLFMVILDNTII